MFASVEEVIEKLKEADYLIDEGVATVIFLADQLEKPVLVEGPAGVGKTDLAKSLASATGLRLIRLQCYEGLDESKALYEWDYQQQLLWIQASSLRDMDEKGFWEATRKRIYSYDFLLKRPLLEALEAKEKVVLLLDEIDKSDREFESFLLEILAEFQVSIPELGTLTAQHRPLVVLTSNNARDFGDALKRRCLHLYIDYPPPEREEEIIKLKVPDLEQKLVRKMVMFIQQLRREVLQKPPGVAESLDWAQSLNLLGAKELEQDAVRCTLPVLLKYESDIRRISSQVPVLLKEAASGGK